MGEILFGIGVGLVFGLGALMCFGVLIGIGEIISFFERMER